MEVDNSTPESRSPDGQSKPEPHAKQEKPNSESARRRLKRILVYGRKNHLAILALVIALMGGWPTLQEWIQPPRVVGKLVDVSYDSEASLPTLSDTTKNRTGTGYHVTVELISLNKSYHVASVRAFVALESNQLTEGALWGSTVFSPNSDRVPIQLLSFLEKDRPRLCDVNIFLEGEQKKSNADMTFERIELRLYGDGGKYKKVDLYRADFPEI